jgi:hypothetical protein
MIMCFRHFTTIGNKWQRFLQIASFFLIIISLQACGDVQTTQIPTSDTDTLPLLTLSPTLKPPQPTNTPSRTATATAQPTWTPVATLPMDIRKQNLLELFSTNGGCDFPCWWGVSPGDSIQKVSELSPVIGKSLNLFGSSLYSYTIALDELNAPDLYIIFPVDVNQIVRSMEIRLREPSRFRDYYDAFEAQLSLASILDRYGQPSDVLFLVTPRFEPGETPRPYTLFLIYDIQGFGIVYSGLVDSENPLRVCSIELSNHRLRYISLYLQNPRAKIAEINRFNSAELLPLEQVTSINLDDFYRIFLGLEITSVSKFPSILGSDRHYFLFLNIFLLCAIKFVVLEP